MQNYKEVIVKNSAKYERETSKTKVLYNQYNISNTYNMSEWNDKSTVLAMAFQEFFLSKCLYYLCR